jgi:pseudouridine-5'-monophosphatase
MAAAAPAAPTRALPASLGPLRGVIFDLDGTLLDTESLLDECASAACAALLGAPAPPAALHSVRGLPDHGPDGWPRALLLALGADAAPAAAAALFAAADALFVARAGEARALPGAAALVGALAARGVPLALATSSTRAALALKRAAHEGAIFRHFSAFVCVEDVAPRAKPDPLCFERAAAALGLTPRECAAVEDSLPGVAAAVAAGCAVVAVPLAAHRDRVRALGAALVLNALDEWDASSVGGAPA